QLLLRDGKKYYEHGQYSESAWAFERLTNKFPAAPGYLEAHLYLGKSRLQLNQYEGAVPPLKYYIQVAGRSPSVPPAKLLLGDAYLGLKKSQEALLTSLEVLNAKPHGEVLLEALLLKTRALTKLEKPKQAKEAFDSYKSGLKKVQTTAEMGAIKSHGLQLET